MADIVRGTVIAGRYVVSEREHPWIHERPELGTVCSAIDAILDEQVTLYIAPTETAGDMLDAARRAALVDDPRLPAILDVGRDEAGFDYCVQEYSGESWLREVLARGPLEPAQARALIGEVADVLTAASRRGLHHLRLGPDSVSLSDDGTVHVHGLAIDAAVADHIATVHLEQISIPQAKREDALSLLDLLYLSQTAHWPGQSTRDAFPAAPREEGRPVPSRVLNGDVDEELDRLLDVVMAGRERGPQSATELSAFLRPWSTETLAGLASRPAPERPPTSVPGANLDASDQASPAAPAGPGPVAPYDRGGAAPSPQAAPSAPAAKDEQRASAAQLQAARRRIARAERPGTKGLAAGVVGEHSDDPFHDELSMRAASTFPVAAEELFAAERDTPDWEPAQRGDTGPIRRYSPETGAIPTVHAIDGAEDDDDAWFLGGMFTTDEEEQQRNLRRRQEETAEVERLRHRMANPAADRRPGAVSPADDPDPSTQQLSIVFEDEPMPPKRLPWAEESQHVTTADQPTIAMAASGPGTVERDEPRVPGESRDTGAGPAEEFSGEPQAPDRRKSSAAKTTAAVAAVNPTAQGSTSAPETEESRSAGASAGSEAAKPEDPQHADPTPEDWMPATPVPAAPATAVGSTVGSSTHQKSGHHSSGPATSGGQDASSTTAAAANSGAKLRGPRPAAKRPTQPSTPPRPKRSPKRPAPGEQLEDIGLSAAGTAHTSLSLKGTSGQRSAPTPVRRAPAIRADQGRAAKSSTATLADPRDSSSRIGPSAATISRPVQTASAALQSVRSGPPATRPAGPPSDFGPGAAPDRHDDERGTGRRRGLAIILAVLAGIILVSLIVFLAIALPGDDDAPTTAAPSETTSGEQSPEEAAPDLVAPEIASVQDADPLGDGDENSDLVDNLLSDSGDAWKTSTYTTAEFGGLKTGLGVVVTLSGAADLGVVEVSSLLAGGSFEIRNGDDPENGDVLGTGVFEDGTTRVELDEAVSTEAFSLWITELPSAGDGYRAEITTISVASE